MEIYLMFMDWGFIKMSILSKNIYRFYAFTVKIPVVFFCRRRETQSKIQVESLSSVPQRVSRNFLSVFCEHMLSALLFCTCVYGSSVPVSLQVTWGQGWQHMVVMIYCATRYWYFTIGIRNRQYTFLSTMLFCRVRQKKSRG